MNSLCNETVKGYISSVVINLSASPVSTMATRSHATVRVETKSVKGGVQLVPGGELPGTPAWCAPPLVSPNDRPGLETIPQEMDDLHPAPVAIFCSGHGQRNGGRRGRGT